MKMISMLALTVAMAFTGPATAVAKVAEVYVETAQSQGTWEKVGVYAPSRAHHAARKLCQAEARENDPVVATRVVGPPSRSQADTVYDCRRMRHDDER